ncbi:mechanosensitive ion channel family protein [Alteriqipengyuania lutimaris]|uniref:Mechanosensitive ion channel protein MscS n=1 Tax=Alteriqipengyuania lutimaris TaxID=1538146 RepID=A0A395LIN2_9SPHN|nr:mechanosensitive ion channel domain-containing protein [Alteriqipengyuania lutimaris]MBB3034617.1 small-conductance mechanosensitive channel [Alteriqipengyuania lutimaris]RDS76509.1 mechanosensitive ion channel protein MscS [Alteriqipengyuania lutimaris]
MILSSASDLFDPGTWSVPVDSVLVAAAILGIAVAIALVAHRIAFGMIRRATAHGPGKYGQPIFDAVRAPSRWLAVAVAISAAAERLPMIRPVWDALSQFVAPVILGWLALEFVRGASIAHERRMETRLDPMHMRSRKTRIEIFRRTASSLIIVITLALVLLSIPGVRQVGVTLMASAGLAALAIGAAAQPALKSLIAGIQMALTEPIRLGDMVVVDGVTGRVEEIRMTFVVVRVWDERVLVVPTGKFFEESFENWSRSADRLTGVVMLNLDPIADVPPIRQAFLDFLADHPLWDRRDAAALVVEAHPESIALRLSMTAASIGEAWDLRCAVREYMLQWLRENQPVALIRHRLEVEAANERAD